MIKKKNSKTHVKVGDQVKIISGKEKGVIGKILFLNHSKFLAQIDSIKALERYFTKPEKQKQLENSSSKELNQKKSIPKFIHVSNLMLWDTETQKSSRIGYKLVENKKLRYFKKSGKTF
jgi:large subunit ribosomal protein L24